MYLLPITCFKGNKSVTAENETINTNVFNVASRRYSDFHNYVSLFMTALSIRSIRYACSSPK